MSDEDAAARHVRGYVEYGERRRLAALRLASVQPGRVARVSFRPGREAPGRARRTVASFIGASASEPLMFALQLVASELVKNAVLYGSDQGLVRMEIAVHRDWIELCVTGGDRIVMSELRSRREGGGRGLEIVDALAWGWTIDSGPLETTVSVRLPIVDSPAEDRQRLACLATYTRGYEMDVPRRSGRCGPEWPVRASVDRRG